MFNVIQGRIKRQRGNLICNAQGHAAFTFVDWLTCASS